jgi:hypothetical protein
MWGSDIALASFPGPERRVHHRVPYSSPAQLRFHDKVYAVSCLNLSLGGAAVKSPVACSPGDALRLSFQPLDTGERFSVRAEIVRVEEGVLGLRFLEFEQRSLTSLLDEVAKSERPPPPDAG